jgi:hypothetical protein
MEKIVDEYLEQNEQNEQFYTPHLLAWKLLTDDVEGDLTNALTAFNIDGQDDDPATFMFEILLTIFMEMFFTMALLMHDTENEKKGITTEFNPDMKQIHINDYIPILEKKFNRVSYIMNITTYNKKTENVSNLKSIFNNRYCRVVFRNSEDKKIFVERNIQNDVHYHMISNELYKKQKELRNIYAIFQISDMMYKISFCPVTKIASNKC